MFAIIPYLFLCIFIGALGHRHRWLGFWGVFALSLLLTPVVGLIVVILSHGGYPKKEQ